MLETPIFRIESKEICVSVFVSVCVREREENEKKNESDSPSNGEDGGINESTSFICPSIWVRVCVQLSWEKRGVDRREEMQADVFFFYLKLLFLWPEVELDRECAEKRQNDRSLHVCRKK